MVYIAICVSILVVVKWGLELFFIYRPGIKTSVLCHRIVRIHCFVSILMVICFLIFSYFFNVWRDPFSAMCFSYFVIFTGLRLEASWKHDMNYKALFRGWLLDILMALPALYPSSLGMVVQSLFLIPLYMGYRERNTKIGA